MEWEFVAGGIESPHVRKLLKDWTADEKALPTLAICGNSAPENVAAALYLPQPLYDRQVPIFVYQKETATILEIARRSSRYRSVYPFGMMCESYDATLKQRIRKAKRINYCLLYTSGCGRWSFRCRPRRICAACGATTGKAVRNGL